MTDVPHADAEFSAAPLPSSDAPVVARAGRYYRNMRYIMTAALFVFAAFFAYDGFKAWPARNAAIEETNTAFDAATTDEAKASLANRQRELGSPKSDTDIALQKVLAFVLPLVAVGYLAFVLRRSRGEIRLENTTLFVPGHSPIPLASVTSVDSTLWKKKGIAVVNYTEAGKTKSLTLDDFIYQQKPIDAIYDRLVAVQPAGAPGV